MTKLAIIVSVLAVGIAAVLANSCTKDPKHMSPVEVVEAAYNAYVAHDFKTFFSYYNMDEEQKAAWTETLETKSQSEDFNGITDFSIKGSSIDGDTATVQIWSKFKDGSIKESSEPLVKTPDGWKLKMIDK